MSDDLPNTFKQFTSRFPELAELHERMGKAASSGPLSPREQALVKIGICLGAGLETAMGSHVRRALEAGISRQEIEHAIVQGMATLGFPRTVAAWAWARAELE